MATKTQPFREAIHAARNRGVVLPDTYYGQLQGVARSYAFSVAGISQLGQIKGVLDSLTSNLENGGTFREWQRQVRDGEIGVELPDHRLENIFRTNLQGHLARGRCEHIERHRDTRPYLRYSAVNDSRTRPSHAAMHGTIARVDDAIWGTWMPPNGYQCRCTVVSLTEKQAQARGVDTGSDTGASAPADVAPDNGWGYSPCEYPDKGTRDALERYGVELPEPFRQAISQIEAGAQVAAAADETTWQALDETGPGGGTVYQAPDGTRYEVRQYGGEASAKKEVAALDLTREMGVDATPARIAQIDGETGVAIQLDERLSDLTKQDLMNAPPGEIAKHFQAAVMTNNTSFIDGLKMAPDGRLVQTQARGALGQDYKTGPDISGWFDREAMGDVADVLRSAGMDEVTEGFVRRLRDLRIKSIEGSVYHSAMPEGPAQNRIEAIKAKRDNLIKSRKRLNFAANPYGEDLTGEELRHHKKSWGVIANEGGLKASKDPELQRAVAKAPPLKKVSDGPGQYDPGLGGSGSSLMTPDPDNAPEDIPTFKHEFGHHMDWEITNRLGNEYPFRAPASLEAGKSLNADGQKLLEVPQDRDTDDWQDVMMAGFDVDTDPTEARKTMAGWLDESDSDITTQDLDALAPGDDPVTLQDKAALARAIRSGNPRVILENAQNVAKKGPPGARVNTYFVKDAAGAATKNGNGINGGHSTEYWNRGQFDNNGVTMMRTTEAFANYVGVRGAEERVFEKLYRQLMPETAAAFDDMVKEIATGARPYRQQ